MTRCRALAGSVALALASACSVARAQQMPATLPDDPAQHPGTTALPLPAGETPDPESDTPPAAAAPEPSVGLRLEAQVVGVVAFPFAGQPGGAAYGFGVAYGAGFGRIPVLLGLDFMSIDSSHTSNSKANLTVGETVLPMSRTWSDRALHFELWLRVQPERWPIRPYVEGFLGATLIQTRYAISVGSDPSQSGSDSDWASGFGWGVGVDFMGLFDPNARYSLTLGLRRLSNAHALLERPTQTGSESSVKKQHVATDATMLMAGLCGRFDFSASEEAGP